VCSESGEVRIKMNAAVSDGLYGDLSMQMGSFSSGGQRYSLMTMDAMRASRYEEPGDREKPRPLPLTQIVHIGNSLHAVQPVRDDAHQITDDAGKTSYWGLAQWSNFGMGSTPLP